MSRDLVETFLLNQLTLAAVAVAVLVILLLAVFVLLSRSRRRRSERERELQTELKQMEHEQQFTAATNRLPHARSSADVARNVSDLFGEFLWSRVLAIYAARAEDEEARNLIPESLLTGTEYAAIIPKSITASQLAQFAWPRVARLSLITGIAGAPNPEAQADPAASSPVREPIDAGSAFATGPLNPPTANESEEVLFLPWSGPFAWSGIIVARVKQPVSAETLAQYKDPAIVVGERLGVALELERLESTLDKASDRSVKFSGAVLAALEDQSPVGSLIKEVASLLSAESAALWRLDPSSGMVSMVASHGLKSAEFLPLPVGQGLAGSVVQSGEMLALEDAPSDPRCIFPREARESGIASYLGAPVSLNEKVTGVLEVHASDRREWTEGDRQLLESAVSVVGQLLKSTEIRRNRMRVETAYLGLSEALQRLRTPDELMEAVVEVLGHALGVSRALLVELDDGGQAEAIRHEYHVASARSAKGATLGGSLSSEVIAAENGKPVVIADSNTRSLLAPAAAAELQVRSELAVAVKNEGQTRAIIYLNQCDNERAWQADEVEFVERVAKQLALSLASVRSLEGVTRDAHAAREAARQATEAGARVQGLINALPECVLVLDGEGRINYFNVTARERLRLTNEDVGRLAGMTEALASADGAIWDQVMACQSATRLEAELSGGGASSPVAQAAAAAPHTRLRMSVSVAPFRASQGGPVVGRIVVLSDVGHLTQAQGSPRISELEQKLAAADATASQAKGLVAAAQAAEANARNELQNARTAEAEARTELEKIGDEIQRAHAAAQQLLETNRLKSDFIVSAGHEIEASLQEVLGMTELLGQGQYGPLTPEQQEAIRNLYSWARRIKGDVDWLIEYGSVRSRRLEPGSE